ncbi:DUF4974 domain-containing protein [Exilibacterium tricleocarpae]|uniref:DUF4974 domain-containing protein n=1 Tax=Exilibacterium tricleocarpae TaxID=2591008 RepID=A0A545SY33_9GAMM|nr:FecR domain-containing protein [Exilibacterium tricleocarpae]TQV69870.1 DUF4974 domain-containing protein [Exilibacterium tricleocarpae]
MNSRTEDGSDKAHIEERALYWFTLMRSDTRTNSDCEAYKTWLNANLAHRRAYRQLEEVWGVTGDFAGTPAVEEARLQARRFNTRSVHQFPPRADTPVATAAPEPESAGDGSGGGRRRWLSAALAASLMFVFLGANITGDAPWEPGVYQTGLGEQKTVVLEDGSKLLLDTQTRVSLDFSPQQRRLVLEQGQARFDVAHDKQRPFVVTAGSGKITALGTVFVVRRVARESAADEVLVTLLEGKVAVAREQNVAAAPTPAQPDRAPPPAQPPATVTLNAGQQVAYSTSSRGISAAATVDLEQATAWQAGRLVFEDHSLAEVLEDLNRYSQTRILLGDDSLEAIKITGVFKTGDNQKVVQTLTTYFDIRVTSDNRGNLILTPAG